jgi:hypothetical protein
MAIAKYLIICLLGLGCLMPKRAVAADGPGAGFLYDSFPLTLAPGHRTEILGPLYYSEEKETQKNWTVPPLGFSHTWDTDVDWEEYDFAYPVLTYDRFGAEYRWQFFQLLSFAGGRNQDASGDHRFTLFPVYFQMRSTDPGHNYTALFPLYGTLKHRLFRDEIDFALFPLYSKTIKKDVVTYNMPYPFFHLRYGEALHGWQLWPLMGREHQDLTTHTNGFGDVQATGGHDSLFVLWPFFTDTRSGLGTENAAKQQGLIPLYSLYRSRLRDSTSYLWPLGVTHTVDREKKFNEWDAPWPFIEFARGEGKTTSRVWPLFSRSHGEYLEDNWYLWPVYKFNRVTSAPLDRRRTRILFFLYSDTVEKNTDTGEARHRNDFWPLFTHVHERNGNERLQALALLEPFFPNNKSIERDWSPLWSLWRAERNPRAGAASQSLLWNLYRREAAPEQKKISLLFGLFQYQSTAEGKRWRVCYIPLGGGKRAP